MTNEEMIKELQKNGYKIHKKMSDKTLNRRNEIRWAIDDYYREALREYKRKTGHEFKDYTWWCGMWTDVEEYAKTSGRNAARKFYQWSQYDEIPDGLWPDVKEVILSGAKRYIDRKVKAETPE